MKDPRAQATVVDALRKAGIAVDQLGATLLVLRTLRGLSLEEVARDAEIPVEDLLEMEMRESLPSDAELLAILGALGMDLPLFFVALQHVEFIHGILQWNRHTTPPGTPSLTLGDGLTLATEPTEDHANEGDGNGEPN